MYNFVTLANRSVRLPADDADASKHVGVLAIYKILLTCVCCAIVGLDNKLYKLHGTYIKIIFTDIVTLAYIRIDSLKTV